MTPRAGQTLALAFLLAVYSGCERPEEVLTPLPAGGEFSARVLPVFREHCGGSSCHGGGPQGAAGGLNLMSHEGVMAGSRYGAVVVPGNVYMSHLIHAVNRSDTALSPVSSLAMPAGRDPLGAADITTLVTWIRNGAVDDAGRQPFPQPRPLGQVYFTSQSVDLVGVLDVQTGLVIRYIPVGNALPFTAPPQAPHNVQVDDQGRFLYVTMISGNSLKKYDALTGEFLGEAAVGLSPAHVVITADGCRAYVTNFSDAVGQVVVVRTATMTVERTITNPLFRKTHGARLSHDGRYLYVGSNTGDLLSIIRTDTDSVVASLHVATGLPSPGTFLFKPYQIAVRCDDQFIYVTCNGAVTPEGNGVVSIFRREGDTFSFVDTVAVGRRPLQCEVTADGAFLYVCNQGSGSVSVIGTATHSVIATIPNVGPQPHGIDITNDSRTAYVTLENVAGEPPHHPLTGGRDPGFVAVIDVASNRVVRRIEVGGFAAGVSVTPGKGN